MRIEATRTQPQNTRPPAQVVTLERTPSSVEELRSAIARAHQKVTGKPASTAFVDLLTAQSSLETARGNSMYNYNFAGIKGQGPSGMTAKAKTHEVLDGKDVQIVDGFRAYGSLDEGAVDYVQLMFNRFGSAVSAAERGDVDGFAHALKKSGYYTASEEDYARALRFNAGMRDPHSTPTLAKEAPAPVNMDSDLLGRVMDMLRSSSARIAAPDEGDAIG